MVCNAVCDGNADVRGNRGHLSLTDTVLLSGRLAHACTDVNRLVFADLSYQLSVIILAFGRKPQTDMGVVQECRFQVNRSSGKTAEYVL